MRAVVGSGQHACEVVAKTRARQLSHRSCAELFVILAGILASKTDVDAINYMPMTWPAMAAADSEHSEKLAWRSQVSSASAALRCCCLMLLQTGSAAARLQTVAQCSVDDWHVTVQPRHAPAAQRLQGFHVYKMFLRSDRRGSAPHS